MKDLFLLSIGVLMIILGLISCSRKKFFMSSFIIQLFIIPLSLWPFLTRDIANEPGGIISSIFFIFFLILFGWIFTGNKYSIENIDKQGLISLLERIFIDKELAYTLSKGKIELEDYGTIKLKQSLLNTVELDLRQLEDEELRKMIRDEVKIGLKSISKRYFPTSGIFSILFGIMFIIA